MENIKYDIWLRNIKGVGNSTFNKLIDCFGSSRAVWEASKKELYNAKIKDELINEILSNVYKHNIEKIIYKLKKENIFPILKSNS